MLIGAALAAQYNIGVPSGKFVSLLWEGNSLFKVMSYFIMTTDVWVAEAFGQALQMGFGFWLKLW